MSLFQIFEKTQKNKPFINGFFNTNWLVIHIKNMIFSCFTFIVINEKINSNGFKFISFPEIYLHIKTFNLNSYLFYLYIFL